jgi:hypothetical protein
MHPSEHCKFDVTQAGTPANVVGDQEIIHGRQELARLIGSLLAHRWLERQNAGGRCPARKKAADQ